MGVDAAHVDRASHHLCRAILGAGHPVMRGTVSSHVEVYSRWETVEKGADEIPFDGKSCAGDEKGDDAGEGATVSAAIRPEPGRAHRECAQGEGKALA